jgi:glycosyltransferase involved in cell wall biosynthesis
LTISNASDLHVFARNTSKDFILPDKFTSRPLFLHIGSLGYIHNCSYIIDAAIFLKDLGYEDKINIVFIGDGIERRDLEKVVTEKGIENVFFMGSLPKHNLPYWLVYAKATLFTTLNNSVQDTSSPNKIFDSFASGLPIIQTTQGWIKDLVDEYNCGINVNPEKPEEMANAMIYLIENDRNRIEMGENAFHLAKTKFNREILAERYLVELLKISQKLN